MTALLLVSAFAVLTVWLRRAARRLDAAAQRARVEAQLARLGPWRSLPRPGAHCPMCLLPEAGPHLAPASHPGWDALLRDVRGDQ